MKEVKKSRSLVCFDFTFDEGFDCSAFMGSFYRITDVITFDVIRFITEGTTRVINM